MDFGRWNFIVDVGRSTFRCWTLDLARCTLHVARQNVRRQTQDVQHSDMDVGCWTFGSWMLDLGNWTLDPGTLDVGTFGHSDVGLDVERERYVGRGMFDSARSTLHVVRSYVGRGWT